MKIRSISLATLALSATLFSCSKKDSGNDYDVKAPTFQYTTTNWDDGWVSNVKEDWAEVTKGSTKVLLHFPKEGTVIAGDPEPVVNTAWNILVSPRYSNLTNYQVASPSLDYERTYIGFGTAIENATNQSVFVALFKKGNSGWMEFVTTDLNSFKSQFGFDPYSVTWSTSSEIWGPLRVMSNYNRFAVAPADIQSTGKWTNNFGSNTYYYSLYTGLSTGMSTYTSTEEYTFKGGNKYDWKLIAANSGGGATNIASAQSSGQYNLPDNWSISLSDIEGAAKTYQVWTAATKGGRILFINGQPFNWEGN